jgi:hypothetical protein
MIYINSEMIKAGRNVYNAWYADPRGELVSTTELVTEVFKAMYKRI